MIDRLDNLIKKIWDVINQGAEAITFSNPSVKYNKNSQEAFGKHFTDMYEYLTAKYMMDADEPLDRHKVAAITIISVIRSSVITCSKVEKENMFWGNYILATDSALVYMLSEMNKRLKSKNKKEISSYFFPKAMACETDYYKIFYRNLYFADENSKWGLNPLDIAERLFLIEYITLEKNEIDPSILREY